MSTEVTDLLVRWKTHRKAEAERQDFVDDVMQELETLNLRYSSLSKKFDSYKEVTQEALHEKITFESQVAELKRASDLSAFTLVIIDGDGAIFQDKHLKKGKEGGIDAANQLRADIKAHLKATYPDANIEHWGLVVHVMVNMSGLARTLMASGVITNVNDFYDFAQGFGLAQPLFAFIDVGSGKERADHKVRETLRIFLPNLQCKHVFFGPCNDTGYLVVLEGYRDQKSKLTLVETRPAEPDFKLLGLPMMQLPNVFRSADLPSRLTASSWRPPTAPAATLSVKTNGQSPKATNAIAVPVSKRRESSTDANSWATISRSKSPHHTIDIASQQKKTKQKYVLLNADGHRLDEPLPKADHGAEQRFYQQNKSQGGNACNNFFLRGHCEQGNYCVHRHSPPMTAAELLVLRHKARGISCRSRGECRDVDCPVGHMCKYGRTCDTRGCWFGETHGINPIGTDMEEYQKPAKKEYEDGTTEEL